VAKARQLHKLFARQIAALSKPGRYSDGGGLYVVVHAGGTKRWVFLFMRDGRQREMGLGSILSIGLAAARERAAECRALLAAGKDPIDVRRAARKAGKGHRTFGRSMRNNGVPRSTGLAAPSEKNRLMSLTPLPCFRS
jgi:hypothetical protein